jgi:hypothetical protein
MTPRSLFNVILKILGIFFLRDILYTIPQIVLEIPSPSGSGLALGDIWLLSSTLLVLIIETVFLYFLVFKTEWMIIILKLDRGFDQETIPLNMHRSTVLRVAIIVIGGLMIAQEIPNFFTQLFMYIREKRESHGQFNPKIEYTVLAGIKVLLGILLIAEQKLWVNLIERQRKKKTVQ